MRASSTRRSSKNEGVLKVARLNSNSLANRTSCGGMRMTTSALLILSCAVWSCAAMCVPGEDGCQGILVNPSDNSTNTRRLLATATTCSCPEGQSCAQDGTSCMDCPAGTFKPATGGCQDDVCVLWGPSSGGFISQCFACGKGRECLNGRCATCSECHAGFYKNFVGLENCRICPNGTYSSITGATDVSQCTTCPAFSTSPAGSLDISACKCFSQYYMAKGADNKLVCQPCPSGALCPGGQVCALNDDSKKCTTSSGTYTITGTWTRASEDGLYELVGCPDGTARQSATSECTSCKPGFQYIINPNTDQCQACPPGLTCTGVKAVTPVLPDSVWEVQGAIWKLKECPSGYVIQNKAADGSFDATVQKCVSCGQGQEYALVDGVATCRACPAGTFKSTSLAVACEACPVDTYRALEGGVTCNDCTTCPMHSTTLAATGRTSISNCVCDEEFYLMVEGDNVRSCKSCPVGGRCPGSRKCALALDNFDCGTDGVKDITGEWTRTSLAAEFDLASCPDGYTLVNKFNGELNKNIQECKACATGFHYIINPNTDVCQRCPPGLTCTGVKAVTPVVPDSVWEQQGAIWKLKECPWGYLIFNTGANGNFDATVQKCVPCGKGQEYAVVDDVPTCRACLAGTYKDTSLAVPCTQCPANTYTPDTGSDARTDCLVCPVHSTTKGATGSLSVDACVCDEELYLLIDGTTGVHGCQSCPVGGRCPASRKCALVLDDFDCNGDNQTDIFGEWSRADTSHDYVLDSCPDGYSLYNTHNGVFNRFLQECKACITGFHYIINPNTDVCQRCPPGLKCTGVKAVTPDVEGSVWVEQGAIWKLTHCPWGYLIFNTDANGNFDATVQKCVPCGPGEEYADVEGTGATCKPCPAGTYKSTYLPVACEACPVDTYRALEGGVTCNDCTTCPMHSTTLAATGRTSISNCVCDEEFYLIVEGDNVRSCKSCPVGGRCPGSRKCALALDNFDCGTDGVKDITGEWTRGSLAAEFDLASCPDGYTLVNKFNGELNKNIQECKACATGFHYIINPNTDVCQRCPPGLTCTGVKAVTPVVANSVWVEQGAIWKLTQCPAGYYLYNGVNGVFDATVQRCIPCGLGKECPAGSCTSCSACAAGKFKDSASTETCRNCPKDTYLEATGGWSAGNCTRCPQGSITTDDGQQSSTACFCSGRYYPSSAPSADLVSCKFCPTVGICSDGACAFNKENLTCAGSDKVIGDWVRDASTNWLYSLKSCPQGYSRIAGPHDAQRCAKCSLSSYILRPDTDVCQQCPPGLNCVGDAQTTPVVQGSVWVSDGAILKLTSCPSNYYLYNGDNGVFNATVQECRPCGAGTECTTASCTACTPCGAGKYKDNASPEACLSCPLNTFNPNVGGDQLSDCQACFSGAITAGTGKTSATDCSCPSRTYMAGAAESKSCNRCPSGALCSSDGVCALSNAAHTCASGSIIGTWTKTGDGDTYVLQSCPAGYQRFSVLSTPAVAHDAQQCKPCGNNQYIVDPNQYTCQACAVGLTCDGDDTVTPKVAGSVWQVTDDIYKLMSCPSGYILYNGGETFNAVAQECRPCGLGQQCSTAECTSCSACRAGTYKDMAGPASCTACPPNTFGTVTGGTSTDVCQNCPDGTFTLTSGSTQESQCICFGRQYRNNLACVNCPVGAVCGDGLCALSFDDRKCVNANAPIDGTWVRGDDNKFKLTTCGAGFQKIDGPHDLQQCIKCTGNQYQLEADAVCKRCPRFLDCDGTSNVVPVVPGSEKELVDGEWKLAYCPAGYYIQTFTIAGVESQECTPCGKGKECLEARCDECTDCTAGHYKDFTGAQPCRTCPQNTYSAEVGATESSVCVACPAHSSTNGLVGQTSDTACTCEAAYHEIASGACELCPAGAMCSDGTCGLRAELDRICPDGTPVVGEWQGPDAAGRYKLASCPVGYKYNSLANGDSADSCEKCLRCPTGGFCRQADYILDNVLFKCEACPVGAICNGSAFASPDFLDELDPGMVWEHDGRGRMWLKRCPEGYQLINNTGYQFQECHMCDEGEYVERSDDPAYHCAPCPPHHACPVGQAPVYSDDVNAQLYISGLTLAQVSDTTSFEIDAILNSVAEAVGVDIGLVLIYQVCDQAMGTCQSINARRVQESAIRRELQYKQRRSSDEDGQRREGTTLTDGFQGAKAGFGVCPDGGVTIQLKLQVPIRPDLSAFDVQKAMLQEAFADQMAAYLSDQFSRGNRTDELCLQVGSTGVTGTAQGRVGWRYNITKEGQLKLVGCPQGWLLINTTIGSQRCMECPKGTYSFDAFDGCKDGSCDERVCNACPDDPVGGAICCGKNMFEEIVTGSVWRNEPFDWGNGRKTIVRRLSSCPKGNMLIRNQSDPTSDHCYRCPPYTFSLDTPSWEDQRLVYASQAILDIAMTNTTTTPCNPCPPGSTCFGGADITPADGYWKGVDMLCPPSACVGDVCDPSLCFPEGGGTARRSIEEREGPHARRNFLSRRAEDCGPECRLRVYVHTCPAGACMTNGTCAPGMTGPACALCEAGAAKVGGNCVQCSGDNTSRVYLLVGVFGPVILVIFYFFSWRPMLFEEVARGDDEEDQKAIEAKRLEEEATMSYFQRLAVNNAAVGWLYEGWKEMRKSARKTKFAPYVKIIISFYNIVGTYPTVFNIYWPETLATIMQITNSVAGVDPLGLPGFICLSLSLSYSTKLLINTITPVAINAVFFIAPIIMMIQRSVSARPDGANRHGGMTSEDRKFYNVISRFCWTMCFSMGLYFPPVSIQVLQSFRCDDVLELLIADYNERCPNLETSGFIFRWSVLSTFIYPFGIPVTLFLMMNYYKVPQMAKRKMDKVYMRAMIALYKKENTSEESEMLVRIIGNQVQYEKDDDDRATNKIDKHGTEGKVKERALDLFKVMDKDSSNSLELDEMVEAFQKFGMSTVNEDKMRALMVKCKAKVNEDGELFVEPEQFVDIILEMTAISFLFTGFEGPDDLKDDQMRALVEYDWSKVGKNKHRGEAGQGKKELDPLTKLYQPELDDIDAMKIWILEKARALRSSGQLALPTVGWGGEEQEPEEQLAIDRVGVVFAAYKVEYWYYELFDMAKKICMTSLLSFFMYGTASQLFLGFFILAASLLSVLRSQPYADTTLSAFQVYSYLVQCVTMLYGICILADTDVDTSSSKTFREGWLPQVIVFIVITVSFFPFALTLMRSKWAHTMTARASDKITAVTKGVKDSIYPSYKKGYDIKDIKNIKVKEVSMDSGPQSAGGNSDSTIPAAKLQRAGTFAKVPTDVEMVPGFNCGPGIFRMYDTDANISKLEKKTHAELVFASRDDEYESDSASSYTGSEYTETDHTGSEAALTARSMDLQPEPRLGPARVRGGRVSATATTMTANTHSIAESSDDGSFASDEDEVYSSAPAASRRARQARDEDSASCLTSYTEADYDDGSSVSSRASSH